MLVDCGVHVGFDFLTVWALEGEKRRTGKKVKMSTALMRDAHFQGLMGLEIKPTTTRNGQLDTNCSRHACGLHLGNILVYTVVKI